MAGGFFVFGRDCEFEFMDSMFPSREFLKSKKEEK